MFILWILLYIYGLSVIAAGGHILFCVDLEEATQITYTQNLSKGMTRQEAKFYTLITAFLFMFSGPGYFIMLYSQNNS